MGIPIWKNTSIRPIPIKRDESQVELFKVWRRVLLGAVSAKTVHDDFCEPVLYPSALAVGSVVIHLVCRCFTPQCSFDLGG